MIRVGAIVLGTLISLGFVSSAQARVFSMNDESFAAYLRGTFGQPVTNTLNSKSSGNNVTLDSEHAYNFSGEFGFIYATQFLNIRFGLEVIKPSDLKDSVGKSSGGSEYYTMTSEISAIVPKMVLEFNVWQRNISRVSVTAGIGYASLVARNSYSMTQAGTTALGVNEFAEDLRGTAPVYEGGLAYERLLSDTTTFVIEAGYRGLVIPEVRHNSSVTTFQGAVNKNDIAKNMDGSNRELDLTNYYGGVGLRFWIH